MNADARIGRAMTRPLTPCGRTRREFLWQAGGGFVGTALLTLLAEDGFFGRSALGEDAGAPLESALRPKVPPLAAKAKACIVLFMYGGVSQVDTFDPKPELNRLDGRPIPILDKDPVLKGRNPGTLLGSSRKFARHGQAGTTVSDLYPHVARCVDDMAVIRGMYTDSFAHGSALLQMNTGFLRQGYPSLGSWVTYGLGTVNQNLPGYVVLLDQRGGPISGPPNWGAGFMPATYQGTVFRTSGEPILNLRPPQEISRGQQRRELDLLAKLSRPDGTTTPESSELRARVASYELAFRMQASAPEAVDIASESAETRRLYGLDDPRTERFARRCLMARRLIERGVRFVQVYSGGGHNDENWDAHGDVNKNHELHCGETDRPIAALLTDLKRRGLLDETLVVWAGEFGRTPTGQNGKGRDHSPRGFTAWMAGGGVKGGLTYGTTDEFGYAAIDKRVHVHDLHATILHLLGFDHTLLTYFHGGRDMRLTDVEGRVVRDLLI
jgi:hypothetical protein